MSVTSPAHETDPRQSAIPDTHGHAKGEHKPYAEERPIPYSARMLFLWFYHACRRGFPRFLMVADHMNSLTFEDPAAVHAVRRAIKHAEAGDLYGAAEIANVEVGHAAVVHEGITRRGMRYSIGAEVDNDPRSRPDAQNIVDAMKPDAMIRSVHFLTIPHPTTGAEYQWPFDNPEFVAFYDAVGTERVWELYVEQLLVAIETLPGHIIGHFYVPAKFGHWPDDAALEAYEDRVVEACATAGKAIELNTRFFYRYATDEESRRKFRDANLRLLRKAKAANVGIAVGSDAHSPKDQGQSFDEALSLLDEAEVNELVFPIAGRLRQVALRASRETLEELAPAPVVAAPAPSHEPPSHAEPAKPAIAAEAPPSEPEPPSGTAEASVAADAGPVSDRPESREEPASDAGAPRPKRAAPKRAAGSSSKRTTPGPAKTESTRGDARGIDASAPPDAGTSDAVAFEDAPAASLPSEDAPAASLASDDVPAAAPALPEAELETAIPPALLAGEAPEPTTARDVPAAKTKRRPAAVASPTAEPAAIADEPAPIEPAPVEVAPVEVASNDVAPAEPAVPKSKTPAKPKPSVAPVKARTNAVAEKPSSPKISAPAKAVKTSGKPVAAASAKAVARPSVAKAETKPAKPPVKKAAAKPSNQAKPAASKSAAPAKPAAKPGATKAKAPAKPTKAASAKRPAAATKPAAAKPGAKKSPSKVATAKKKTAAKTRR